MNEDRSQGLEFGDIWGRLHQEYLVFRSSLALIFQPMTEFFMPPSVWSVIASQRLRPSTRLFPHLALQSDCF